MKKFIIVFVLLFFFAGCASRAQIADICTSYGFEQGTESFANCMRSETQFYREKASRDWDRGMKNWSDRRMERAERYGK